MQLRYEDYAALFEKTGSGAVVERQRVLFEHFMSELQEVRGARPARFCCVRLTMCSTTARRTVDFGSGGERRSSWYASASASLALLVLNDVSAKIDKLILDVARIAARFPRDRSAHQQRP